MILGMSIGTFISLHVVLSLTGITSGLVVLIGMLQSKRLKGWTDLFFLTTILTSVTGFMIPSAGFGPSQVVGVISLLFLVVAVCSLYFYKLTGWWRWLYVVSTLVALYLNIFVGVVQAFRKVSVFIKLAPTQTEWPFVVSQAIVLLAFLGFGVVAIKIFHPHIKSSQIYTV